MVEWNFQWQVTQQAIQIRVAPAGAANVKPNADKLLLSKDCNKGKYSFITGVQKTNYENGTWETIMSS